MEKKQWLINKENYTKEFRKKNYTYLSISLNVHKDTDIIEYLGGIENKTDYLKELIRKDLENKKAPQR